ncbi:MAG: hypothetical protein LUC90_02170 [Lachnospiraceae bacterium]|nr:hypothetical protein [Lachnospiraceae bacterium]
MKLEWKYLPAQNCYVAENLSYCKTPSNPDLQALHIYVPACYMKPDGSIDSESVHSPRPGISYTAKSVPVIFYNDIGGYSECVPAGLIDRNREFVKDGFVLVSIGARGRQSMDKDKNPSGKAPAGLVDLKAGVRWLRRHRDELPGNYDRIISVGASAGGAMSSLLGATGNDEYFLPFLEEIGAEMEERDDVYAAQCYCPITDLDHADLAYEWMFQTKAISTRSARELPIVMDDFHRGLSGSLAAAYPDYINSLCLGAELGADGRSGSFYTGLMEMVSGSLTKFLKRNPESADWLVEEINAGTDLIRWNGDQAVITDLDKYVRVFIGRMKPCPVFDGLSCETFENQEFGTKDDLREHFSTATAEIFSLLRDKSSRTAPAETDAPKALKPSADKLKTTVPEEWEISPEMEDRARHFNPLYYILASEKESNIAPHYRIRLGSKDADTSFGISYSLYLALRAAGIDADYALVWGLGHCNADYPGEFAAWADSIC